MRYFAELAAPGSGLELGVVRCVWEQPDDAPVPEYAPQTVVAVEVTDCDPRPSHGWLYDAETDRFTAPPVPEPVTEPEADLNELP